MEIVHALLFNFEKMPEWNPGLAQIEYDPNEPLRLGLSHTCFFDASTAEITLDRLVEKKNEVMVTNRMKIPVPVLQASAIYHLKRETSGTIEFHPRTNPTLHGWLLTKSWPPDPDV
jgi:hypothetical protein